MMIDYFSNYNPVILALFGGIFSAFITSLGSSIVFFFKRVNKYLMTSMLSISAGIMFSASFFSLLNQAILISSDLKQNFFITVVLGFLLGSIFVYIGNKCLCSLKITTKFNLRRCLLLFASITLHNIPEGLAIGVAFGNIIYGGNILEACILTLGIAIQNFPEGAAISLPLRRENVSTVYSFLFGSISSIVEPIFAVIGALLVLKINSLLSFILAFAAGAMIFVTVLELIPESQSTEKKDLMALLFIIGFIIMMILDVLLG